MTRVLGRLVSLEMALLGLCELALTFVVIYAMLTFSGKLTEQIVGVGFFADSANLAGLLAGIILMTAAAIGLYRPEICIERRRLLINTAVAGLLAFPIVLLVTGGLHIGGLSRHTVIVIAKALCAWLVCMTASRFVFLHLMRERWFVRRILILGDVTRSARIRQWTGAGRGRLFEPILPLAAAADLPTADVLRQQRIWGIVVANPDTAAPDSLPVSQLLDYKLLDYKLRGVPVFNEASFCEQHLGRIDLENLQADWLLYADGFANGAFSNLLKRGFDILVSLALLFLTLPLMLLTALLVYLDSPGPVLYRQTRVGLHGKSFTLFKFRSMAIDAEASGSVQWAAKRDPRITRVGNFIRPMRIDELPQLINVLFGEMSLIGPRPERPQFVEQLARIIPFYHERSYVKPGITGWAQVNFPYGASVEDARQKLSYDLYYVKNRSLVLDVLILLATIRVILFREGAR